MWRHLLAATLNTQVIVTYSTPTTHKQTQWRLIQSSLFLQNKFMPDIEQVTVFRHCIRMFANLCRRYAACAAKKLAECARESRRWQENLNWQIQGCTVVASHLYNLHATVDKPLHLDKTKWNVYNFRSRSVSSQTAELPSCASSLPLKRKHKWGGKKVHTCALRQHTAIENLLTDAAQQPLEFYDSRPSVQAAVSTPVVSPDVLLGESACRSASTASSPAACSNELLEILNGLDAHSVEVNDAVLLHLDSEYDLLWMSFCILVLIVNIFSEQHEHGERRVLDRPRSGGIPRQVIYDRQHVPSIICTESLTSYLRWMPPVPCASSATCVGKASCTTLMKLSSTKLPCTPSSGEPNLVGVQISMNGCVGGMGQALSQCAFFSWIRPSQHPTGCKGNTLYVPSRLW